MLSSALVRQMALRACLALFPLFCSQPSHSAIRTYERLVAPGITFSQTVDPAIPLTASVLTIDPSTPGADVRTFIAHDQISPEDPALQRETVTSAVKRLGAVGGINGDFFPWSGDPDGLFVLDGRLVSQPYFKPRPVFGIRNDGKLMMGIVKWALSFEFPRARRLKADGVNKPLEAGEMVVYERLWAPRFAPNEPGVAVVLKVDWPQLLQTGRQVAVVQQVLSGEDSVTIPGDGILLAARGRKAGDLEDAAAAGARVIVSLNLVDDDGRSWLGMRHAVGGEPQILKAGRPTPKAYGTDENRKFATDRHPRTSVGFTPDNKIVFAVVDGRQTVSRGADLLELAQVMMREGCVEAMNLDGGGSSAIVIGDLVINSPSDGWQRATASGLLAFSDSAPPVARQGTPLEPAAAQLQAGKSLLFHCPEVAEPSDSTPFWGTVNGGGFIEQNGLFTALRAGEHTVVASAAGSRSSARVEVSPGAASTISLSWGDRRSGEGDARTLLITVRDSLWNPVPGSNIQLEATGGSADPREMSAGERGTAQSTIRWHSAAPVAGRKVVVNVGGLTAQIAAEEKKE